MLFFISLWALAAQAQVTTHPLQAPVGVTSAAAPGATYAGPAAYDPRILNGPGTPQNPSTAYNLQITANNPANLSLPQSGSFFGFSIETSVVNQVLGINASHIKPPFLNLMANLVARSGEVHIRIGGNTQEDAVLVPSLADGKMIEKSTPNSNNPTQTPGLVYTPELIYLLSNVSSLLNVKWYLGIPFNDSANLRLGIAELGEQVLGKNLLGMQAGNEPDLYAGHQRRQSTYSPYDYFGEFGVLVQAVKNDPKISNKSMLIAPSVASGPSGWTPEMVWNTNFAPTYADSLSAFAVEHYPNNNCAALYGTAFGPVVDPQATIGSFLSHKAVVDLVSPYINSANIAKQFNKPFIMFETNTASCGGFPGISSSLTAALWAIDYGLQMAVVGFTGANVHVGGQNVYYNPFTAPPSNQTNHQWTIGGIFYAHLVLAEVFGTTGTAQVLDLNANGGNDQTPAYAIYENGAPARLVLFNYVDDNTGKNDYTVTVSYNGGNIPGSVKTKTLTAPGVGNKANITWAGQGFGGDYESDGILRGDPKIDTVQCSNNACAIKVKAPSIVVVFMSDGALQESDVSSAATFATTAVTKKYGTATVAPAVLATSNGHSGKSRQFGSTSKGSVGGAASSYVVSSSLVLFTTLLTIAWLR